MSLWRRTFILDVHSFHSQTRTLRATTGGQVLGPQPPAPETSPTRPGERGQWSACVHSPQFLSPQHSTVVPFFTLGCNQAEHDECLTGPISQGGIKRPQVEAVSFSLSENSQGPIHSSLCSFLQELLHVYSVWGLSVPKSHGLRAQRMEGRKEEGGEGGRREGRMEEREGGWRRRGRKEEGQEDKGGEDGGEAGGYRLNHQCFECQAWGAGPQQEAQEIRKVGSLLPKWLGGNLIKVRETKKIERRRLRWWRGKW